MPLLAAVFDMRKLFRIVAASGFGFSRGVVELLSGHGLTPRGEVSLLSAGNGSQ